MIFIPKLIEKLTEIELTFTETISKLLFPSPKKLISIPSITRTQITNEMVDKIKTLIKVSYKEINDLIKLSGIMGIILLIKKMFSLRRNNYLIDIPLTQSDLNIIIDQILTPLKVQTKNLKIYKSTLENLKQISKFKILYYIERNKNEIIFDTGIYNNSLTEDNILHWDSFLQSSFNSFTLTLIFRILVRETIYSLKKLLKINLLSEVDIPRFDSNISLKLTELKNLINKTQPIEQHPKINKIIKILLKRYALLKRLKEDDLKKKIEGIKEAIEELAKDLDVDEENDDETFKKFEEQLPDWEEEEAKAVPEMEEESNPFEEDPPELSEEQEKEIEDYIDNITDIIEEGAEEGFDDITDDIPIFDQPPKVEDFVEEQEREKEEKIGEESPEIEEEEEEETPEDIFEEQKEIDEPEGEGEGEEGEEGEGERKAKRKKEKEKEEEGEEGKGESEEEIDKGKEGEEESDEEGDEVGDDEAIDEGSEEGEEEDDEIEEEIDKGKEGEEESDEEGVEGETEKDKEGKETEDEETDAEGEIDKGKEMEGKEDEDVEGETEKDKEGKEIEDEETDAEGEIDKDKEMEGKEDEDVEGEGEEGDTEMEGRESERQKETTERKKEEKKKIVEKIKRKPQQELVEFIEIPKTIESLEDVFKSYQIKVSTQKHPILEGSYQMTLQSPKNKVILSIDKLEREIAVSMFFPTDIPNINNLKLILDMLL